MIQTPTMSPDLLNPKHFCPACKEFPAFLLLFICLGFSSEAIANPSGWKSSGIADIDETRIEVEKSPTTSGNAIARRATLYRWWRFLMHQGYDMSSFDECADILLQETADLLIDQEFSSPKARQAITDGFAVLEDIFARDLYIREVQGSGPLVHRAFDETNPATDWPFYHGTNGAQTGYSLDPGPSEGMLIRTGGDNFLFDKDNGKLLRKTKTKELFTYSSGGQSIILANAGSGDIVWKKDMEDWLAGEPIINEQRVFAATTGGKIVALDTNTGDLIWTAETGAPLDGPVSAGKGRLYAGSRDARLYCLDPADGSVIWTFQSPDKESRSKQYYSAASEADGRVYVGSAGKYLYCLHAHSGNQIWKHLLSDWIRSRPILEGNKVFASTLDGKPFALRADAKKGKQIWVTDLSAHGVIADVGGGGLFPTPSVVDGVVYIGGPDGFVNAIDVDSGKEIWRFETKSTTSAAITVAAEKVFFGSLGPEPEYYALDRKTGELIWESNSFSRVWVGASYNDGRLVFGDTRGNMFAADALNGEKIWEYNIKQDIADSDHTVPGLGIFSNPVFDDNYVYMGSWFGYYMAFDQATGKIKWQWKAPYGWIQNGTVAAFNDKIFGSAVREVVILPYGCRIYAFDDVENGGGLLWEYEGGGVLTAPVGTDDKLIFGSSGDVHMTCLNPEDGSLKWRLYTGGIMLENVPAIYGNKVIAHFKNGWLLAIE